MQNNEERKEAKAINRKSNLIAQPHQKSLKKLKSLRMRGGGRVNKQTEVDDLNLESCQ
jgi:hypothetical protein